jgi:hypothetical protein
MMLTCRLGGCGAGKVIRKRYSLIGGWFMLRSWPEAEKLNAQAIWLPCGVQNYYNPAARDDRPKVMLEGEMNLIEHLRHREIVVPDPQPSGWRNMYFAWAEHDGQFLYTDSDGFIIAACAPGAEPKLPELVTANYWVHRSKHVQPGEGSDARRRAGGVADDGAADQVGASGDEPASHHTMLTNFQMNILFEGIWNSASDPRVFLLSNKTEAVNVEKGFTFGQLRDELVVSLDNVPVDRSAPFPVSLRRLIFLQAIRAMRNEHLLPLKWNIEASRRHLFSETMTMLHRPESLKQYVSKAPSAAAEPGRAQVKSFTSRDELFTRSSDEQLRGYVMLISAKLPLIDNLTFLIGDCWEGLALDSELNPDPEPSLEPDRHGIPRVIHDVVATWRGTADALHKNVEALERSFANIWQDKLLHETEQVRVEEEALGELQRQQARDKSDRWFDSLIFVVTLAVAGAALYFSINGAQPIKNNKDTVFLIAGLIVALLTVGFWVMPKAVSHYTSEFIPRFELVARLDEPLDLSNSSKNVPAPADARKRPMLDWMNIPFRRRFHEAIAGSPAAESLAPRWPRLLATKRMQEWMGLPCSTSGWGPDEDAEHYPVGVLLAGEAPRIRVDSPGEIDTYSRIHLDVKVLLPRRRHFSKQAYRPVLKNITGWYHRLMGSYLITFPRRCVTVQCAIELHKHSPDPGVGALYFLREVRLIMSSREELLPEETLISTLVVDFLLVRPWVQPYFDSDERRSSVRVSLLTDRLEAEGWNGTVLPDDSALVQLAERDLLQQQADGGGHRDGDQGADDAEQDPADQHRHQADDRGQLHGAAHDPRHDEVVLGQPVRDVEA